MYNQSEQRIKIAVMADIHSNSLAFQACVDKAIIEGVDQFIFLGDYLGEMAYPQRTLAILKKIKEEYPCTFIRGNKEDYWIHHRNNPNEIWENGRTTTGILKYVYEQLTDEEIDMFEEMPITTEMKYDGFPLFTVCHSSPIKVNQSMRPDYDYIEDLIHDLSRELIICGHFHIQTDYVRGTTRVINPGAVGVALHSGGLGQFMILIGNDGVWEPQFYSIRYDVEEAIRQMEEEKLDVKAPGWFRMTKNLLTTGEKSMVTMLSEVQHAYYEETGISDYRMIPEEFWKKALDKMGL